VFNHLTIFGIGHIGSSLASVFRRAGINVLGIDPGWERTDVAAPVEEGSSSAGFSIRTSLGESEKPQTDAYIICVPTPLDKHRQPDLSNVVEAGEEIAAVLKRDQLVVLASTTYPGTTAEVLVPILEKGSGLSAESDFFVAFSPERTDPGRPLDEIPKIVGGYTQEAGSRASALYERAFASVIMVEDERVAEAAKILENVFRCVNIALVNELKVLFQEMGIDIWDVIAAASTKPFGYLPFYPGPGLGGHCIPIDPFYLTWKAKEYGLNTKFIELAGEINSLMPEYVVSRLVQGLSRQAKPLKDARILLLGMAYKPGVSDTRESPALRILEILTRQEAKVSFHDPFVNSVRAKDGRELESVALDEEVLRTSDAVVVVTDHPGVDYAKVSAYASLVVDTRNAIQDPPEPSRIVKA
jgi:UDP-N-acetyl-D-glucosamine dehydrogenase